MKRKTTKYVVVSSVIALLLLLGFGYFVIPQSIIGDDFFVEEDFKVLSPALSDLTRTGDTEGNCQEVLPDRVGVKCEDDDWLITYNKLRRPQPQSSEQGARVFISDGLVAEDTSSGSVEVNFKKDLTGKDVEVLLRLNSGSVSINGVILQER